MHINFPSKEIQEIMSRNSEVYFLLFFRFFQDFSGSRISSDQKFVCEYDFKYRILIFHKNFTTVCAKRISSGINHAISPGYPKYFCRVLPIIQPRLQQIHNQLFSKFILKSILREFLRLFSSTISHKDSYSSRILQIEILK